MSTIDQYLTAVEARVEKIETAYEQESYDDNYTVTVVSSRMYQAIEASSWDVPDLTKALRAVLDAADPDGMLISFDASWVAGYMDAMEEVTAAITAALSASEEGK